MSESPPPPDSAASSPTPANPGPENKPAPQRSHIFISYSRSDRLAVDQIYNDLRKKGFRLWMDVSEQGIEPGEDWRKELVKQMTDAEAVIAYISPDMLRSAFCKMEIEQAIKEGKPIFPVIVRRLDEGQSLADLKLDHLQYIDFTLGYADGLQRLEKRLPRPSIMRSAVARRAGMGLAGAVLLLLFAGVIALASGLGSTLFEESPTATFTPTEIPSVQGKTIGVAVAEFTVPDDGSIDSDEAHDFSEAFRVQLQDELESLFAQSDQTVGVLSPSQIGTVEGETPGRRKINAARIIEERTRGVDIIIYGELSRDNNGIVSVQPEFYVPEDIFSEADDITGAGRFGGEIPLSEPIADAFEDTAALSARATALSKVVQGLAHYVNREYTDALRYFEEASQVSGWDTGREVLYILEGNAQLKLGDAAAQVCDGQTTRVQVALAKEAYNKAIDEVEESGAARDVEYFSRPYTGLASATLIEALWSDPANDGCAASNVNRDLLNQTLILLEQSERIQRPEVDYTPSVQLKSNFTRAQTYFWLWLTGLVAPEVTTQEEMDEYVAEFDSTTMLIINTFNSSNNPIPLRWMAFETYTLRGQFFQQGGDCDAAIEAYADALKIEGTALRRQMVVTEWTAYCYEDNGNIPRAIEAYESARDLALDIEGAEDDAAYFTEQRDRLRAQLQEEGESE